MTFLLWSFVIVLLSSVSTTIFSEQTFHDQLAFAAMLVAIVGLVISAAFLLVDTLQNICNP